MARPVNPLPQMSAPQAMMPVPRRRDQQTVSGGGEPGHQRRSRLGCGAAQSGSSSARRKLGAARGVLEYAQGKMTRVIEHDQGVDTARSEVDPSGRMLAAARRPQGPGAW
jgi:hypothetical protein